MVVVPMNAKVVIEHHVALGAFDGAEPNIDWANIVGTCVEGTGGFALPENRPAPPLLPLRRPGLGLPALHRWASSRDLPLLGREERNSDTQHMPAILEAILASAPLPPSRRATQTVPPGCTATWQAAPLGGSPPGDDDDATSRTLSWGLAVHCSHAGLTAIPMPLPPDAQYLHLGHNDITALPEGVFGNTVNVTKLALNNNAITTLPPGVFANLLLLKGLFLYNNAISTLPPGVFANLTQLQQL